LQLLRGWEGGTERGRAPDPASFIIDGDEGRVPAKGAEVIGELAGLPGTDQIAGKKDKSAGLQFAIESNFPGGEVRTAETQEEKLMGRHGVLR
jgi:hypothetical protein